MIAVSDVVERLVFVLDAEGSDRYRFANDYKPAINSAVEWIQTVLNRAYSERKLTEENLGELARVSVFQTNAYSRFKMDPSDLGHSIWTILSVIPEITTYPANATITATPNDYDSLYRDDVTYVRSNFSAKRATPEEWEENNQNVFSAGNSVLNNTLRSFAYLNMTNYSSSSYSPDITEIEIRPVQSKRFVAVRYLMYPAPIQLESDTIDFPRSLTTLVAEKAAMFISQKQNDGTNLRTVTDAEVNTLIKMIM